MLEEKLQRARALIDTLNEETAKLTEVAFVTFKDQVCGHFTYSPTRELLYAKKASYNELKRKEEKKIKSFCLFHNISYYACLTSGCYKGNCTRRCSAEIEGHR